MSPFTEVDLLLLLRLIAAHLIVDFLLQPNSCVQERLKRKWASPWLYLHAFLAAGVAYGLAGEWKAVWLLPIIFASHLLLDGFKSQSRNTIRVFFADQLGHFIVIFLCWIQLADATSFDVGDYLGSYKSNYTFWIVAMAYIIAIVPSGILIGKFTSPWREELGKNAEDEKQEGSNKGLQQAGLWIGRLERFLILTFVLFSRFEAIGFLIAAKSIFRFGDIRQSSSRKHAEYILIGTLLSFGVALTLGIFADWLIGYFESRAL